MNKRTLIKLRCKAWGITEDEYYCNQCSDFSLEDMARAYRRGKNKGRADNQDKLKNLASVAEVRLANWQKYEKEVEELRKEVELWKKASELNFYKAFQAQEENKSLTNIKNIYIGDLLKAKELLNEFMRISKASDEDFEHDYSELIGEAEQFIK